MEKRIIWSNMDLDLDDWRDGYAEYCEYNGIEQGGDEEAYFWMEETNAIYLDDERANLNTSTGGRVIVFADLGRWNGRAQEYRITSANLNSILDIYCDMFRVYSDGRDIRADGVHHDGRNYYLFRAIRDGQDVEPLLEAIYNGERISRQKLNYYTRSLLPDVARVYGWQ